MSKWKKKFKNNIILTFKIQRLCWKELRGVWDIGRDYFFKYFY